MKPALKKTTNYGYKQEQILIKVPLCFIFIIVTQMWLSILNTFSPSIFHFLSPQKETKNYQ